MAIVAADAGEVTLGRLTVEDAPRLRAEVAVGTGTAVVQELLLGALGLGAIDHSDRPAEALTLPGGRDHDAQRHVGGEGSSLLTWRAVGVQVSRCPLLATTSVGEAEPIPLERVHGSRLLTHTDPELRAVVDAAQVLLDGHGVAHVARLGEDSAATAHGLVPGLLVLRVATSGVGGRGARGLRGNAGHGADRVHRHLRVVPCLVLHHHPVPARVGDHAVLIGAGTLVRELVDGVAVVVGHVVHGAVGHGRIVLDGDTRAQAPVALLGDRTVLIDLEVLQVSVGGNREVPSSQLPPGPLLTRVLLARVDTGHTHQVVGVVLQVPVLCTGEDRRQKQQAVHDLGVAVDHRRNDDRDTDHEQATDHEGRELLLVVPPEGSTSKDRQSVHEDHGRNHAGEDAERDTETTHLVGLLGGSTVDGHRRGATHEPEGRGDQGEQGGQRHQHTDEPRGRTSILLGNGEQTEGPGVLRRSQAQARVGGGLSAEEDEEPVEETASPQPDSENQATDDEQGHAGHFFGIHENSRRKDNRRRRPPALVEGGCEE